MSKILLINPTIVTSDREAVGTVLISDGIITEIIYKESGDYELQVKKISETLQDGEIYDLSGKHLIAGGIDAHVHFREPGLTHKADMETESKAAAAGGAARWAKG